MALYGNDSHSAKALSFAQKLSQPVSLSIFNEFELENALRLASWRKLFPSGDIDQFQADFEADRNIGRVVIIPCNLADVLSRARQLSAAHTLTGGHRAFDILHVAAALECKADRFLTFDANQRKLAQAEGLKVNS
jgi:predicted nucleic acid-binding protein